MNAIKSLHDFIKIATAERKYADNTARGLNAALKLFEPHLNETEKQSLDAFEGNLENIANDIFSKRKDGKPTSDTLMVYKRRVHKVIADYKSYGNAPGKMALWNPRRSAPGLKTKNAVSSIKGNIQVSKVIEDEPSGSVPLPRPVVGVSPQTAQGGVTGFDAAGRYVDTNRSEIFLREAFKVILELPVDLSEDEARKLKQYIDLMVAK
ncbi:MAG TPA: hypothetical protein VFI74_04995 [Candidatus Saccharimonadales bacterium]|nr:hypothetical protein [Candidatus Saccharimonadales bacterium]